ncbi:MAG: MFS transporter [Candidatus Latescibacterota bacterium]
MMRLRTEAQEAKRNYNLLIWNGILVNVAFAFINPALVLSAFMYTLTASSFYVGLVTTIMGVGFTWPQLVISNMVEHRERKMPFYLYPAILRTTFWLAITLFMLFIGNQNPRMLLWVCLILFGLYWSAGGVAMVPFMDITAKVVPVNQRARLFSTRRLWGGSLAVLSGFFVRYILSEDSGLAFPANYGVLFGCATIFVTLGMGFFVMVREPIHPVAKTRNSLSDHVASGIRILRDDPNYRRFLVARTCWVFGLMGIPFYWPYAVAQLGMHESAVGLFLSVSVISGVLSNLLWMRIGTKSSRIILEWGIILVFVSPLLAALTSYIPNIPLGVLGSLKTVLYFFVYASSVAGLAGINLGDMTYLLEIAPSRVRPLYVGFMYTFSFPLTFIPALAGAAIHYVSYQPIFLISAFFCIAAIFAIRGLDENHETEDLEEKRIGIIEH